MLICLAMLAGSIESIPHTAAQGSSGSNTITEAFATINQYRERLGLPLMSRSSSLDKSAQSHANYYQLNQGNGSLSGMGLHAEQAGLAGFTGADMQDRANAAGYNGWVNENIGLSGSMMASVDWFIASVNHRLTLIDPRYTDIGFGEIDTGSTKIEVIDVGAPTWSSTADPAWIAWPPDGAKGVGLSFNGETPNPLPGASLPVGYPITLKYLGAGSVNFQGATLTTGGKQIPVISAVGSGWLTQQTEIVAAANPLAPNTTYTVSVNGTANGQSFNRQWSFTTGASDAAEISLGVPSGTKLPAGVASADPSVQLSWWLSDGQRASSAASWTWGPDVIASAKEPYAGAPGGERQVYYFDKGRMEISDPNADRSNPWFVTSGLLVRDMILGAIQTGDDSFQPSKPAQIPLAGDQTNNGTAPTYASLTNLASLHGDHRVSQATGQPVNTWLDKEGRTGVNPSLGAGVTLKGYDSVTGHNLASVFTDWLAAQSWNSLQVMGRPIAEPYWVFTKLSGKSTWVLVQAFERRILTYTPSNAAGWQIEMGNAGLAYYQWRYGKAPGSGA